MSEEGSLSFFLLFAPTMKLKDFPILKKMESNILPVCLLLKSLLGFYEKHSCFNSFIACSLKTK